MSTKMHVYPVSTKQDEKDFIDFAVALYKKDTFWIRPLDKDINVVFDKVKNKFFRHGICQRWLVKDENNVIQGRIAAFINKKTADSTEYKTGGIGFFECTEDYNVAKILFDTAVHWNEDQGMEAIDGPINFGERDKWWGLLVDGYDQEPNYCMPYHKTYYKQFFEQYGFRDYFQQYTYAMPVQSEMPEKYKEKALRIARDPRYNYKNFDKKKIKQFASDFVEIYNKAWVKHGGVKGMNQAQAENIFNQLKPVADPDIVVFAYYDHTPIGFFIMIPELNQIFKYLNGQFDIWAKIKFLYHQKIKKSCRKMFGVAFGIIPEFQGRGVEGAVIMEAARIIQPKDRYDIFEMNWIGDFNPKMIHLVSQFGAKVVKTHITYRYIFDKNKQFYRAKVID